MKNNAVIGTIAVNTLQAAQKTSIAESMSVGLIFLRPAEFCIGSITSSPA
jgi:hypothetical protein